MALKERGIDKLVDEAREDNKDNDLKHTGTKSKLFNSRELRL